MIARYCKEPHDTVSSIGNLGPSSTSRKADFRMSIHTGGVLEPIQQSQLTPGLAMIGALSDKFI